MSDTPQRTGEPLSTCVSLTAQEFLPAFLPLPSFSRLCLLISHPGPRNWESRADHRRTSFPLLHLSARCTPEAGEGPSPGSSGAKCTRHTTWMLSWRGAEVASGVSDDREAATVKQKPRPAEIAPGITNKGPDDTLASLPPNTRLPGF